MLFIILKAANVIFFTFNNSLLIFKKASFNYYEINRMIVHYVSLLTKNLNNVIFVKIHELNKVVKIIICYEI